MVFQHSPFQWRETRNTLLHCLLFATGNAARLEFDLNSYKTEAEVDNALDNVQYNGGNTNTTGGLNLARTRVLSPQYGARPNTTHIMILITDGNPTYDADKLQDAVDEIKAEGIKLIAIGVTNQVKLAIRMIL